MIIDSELLKTKLKYLGLAISKDVTALPKYKMILFKTESGVLNAFTYDGINNIKVTIDKCTDDITALIEYSTFNDFIKSCEGDIKLDFSDKFINIKTSTVKVKLPLRTSSTPDGGVKNPYVNHSYDYTFNKDLHLPILKSIIDPAHVVESYRKVCFNDNIMVSDTDNVLIIKDRIFKKDILLNVSSLEILNCIHNVKYIFWKSDVPKIYLTSDELDASFVIDLNEEGEYQYDELIDLFNNTTGDYVEINTKELTKAINTGKLFKADPKIVFNDKGIFLNIQNFDFIYKISDTPCKDREFIIDSEVVKKISNLGDNVKVYYTNEGLIKCEVDEISEILSIKEISNE